MKSDYFNFKKPYSGEVNKMQMLKSKSGKYGGMGGGIQNVLTGGIEAVLLITILIGFIAVAIPILTLYFGYLATNMSASGIPFSQFFNSNGLIYLALGGIVVIVVIGALFLWMRSMLHKGGR